MPFHIPDEYCGFYDEVRRRVLRLINKRVIDGIDETRLNKWLSNFRTQEERYLAAHILHRLIYRSSRMVDSSISQVLHSLLPSWLRKNSVMDVPDLPTFLGDLKSGDARAIRFVAAVFKKTSSDTGKSGDLIVRAYKRSNVSKSLLLRPDCINAGTLRGVKALIFVDDLLGTGRQFLDFAEYIGASELKVHMVYYPLIACEEGLRLVRNTCRSIEVDPIEVLSEEHSFFAATPDRIQLWAGDRTNTVEDVRDIVRALEARATIRRGKYCKDLVLGFQHAAPNTTIPLIWSDTETWDSLISR